MENNNNKVVILNKAHILKQLALLPTIRFQVTCHKRNDKSPPGYFLYAFLFLA